MLLNQENIRSGKRFLVSALKHPKNHWLFYKTEVLSGITVALALIPESLAFAAIAQVNPMVALYTSFCMAVVIAIAGGRPAMISAATGSMALLMTSLVREHGVEYLFAATIATGVIQVLMGLLRIDRFFSFIPQTVIAGFVNALGILIFIAQLTQFVGEPWPMYVMVAVTLAIVYLFPRLTKSIPSPLVAIVTMTIVAMVMHLNIRRVGDIGQITRSLPALHLPQVSLSLETLAIILPYAVALAIVGLMESLLTAALVDEMTETTSSRNRETRGQGIANIVTGFLGGMAGCGMVGQSIINVRSGGRKRLSTAVAGAFLLFAIFGLRDVVQQIPMAALVGVMIMVASETFDWRSLQQLRRLPLGEAMIMPLTMVVTLSTHNLAYGVVAGVVTSTMMFGWQAAQIRAISAIDPVHDRPDVKVYNVSGNLFFGSASRFVELFDYRHDPDRVVLNLNHVQVWDYAGAAAVIKTVHNYERLTKQISIVGLNVEGRNYVQKLGIPEHVMSYGDRAA